MSDPQPTFDQRAANWDDDPRKLARAELVASLEDVCDDFDLAVSLMALHHVDDPAQTIVTLANRLKPGGRIALCDLEPEDGSFHDPGTTGVHFGFSRQQLGQWCQDAGLRDFCCGTVASVERDSDQGTRRYPLFLMEARRAL